MFLVNGGGQPFVIRKLATSLATIFLKANSPWAHAIWNLAASLANGKYISEEQCQSVDLQNAVLPAMAERQVMALLYFANILGEEINKWSSESRRRGADSDRISKNAQDAFLVVEFVLRHIVQQEVSGNPLSDGSLGIEAINAFHVSLFPKLRCVWRHLTSIHLPVMDGRSKCSSTTRLDTCFAAELYHGLRDPEYENLDSVQNRDAGSR